MQALLYLLGVLSTIEFFILAFRHIEKIEPSNYTANCWLTILLLSLLFPATYIIFIGYIILNVLYLVLPKFSILTKPINKLFK